MSESADSGIFPRFYIDAVRNNFKSEDAGHPIFDEVEMLEICIAGDTKNVVTRKVRDTDIQRWPAQYEQFKRKEKQVTEGFPVIEWPAISRAEASSLKALNIHTVEALSELSDTGLQALGMGARELQKKAVNFLALAKDSALAEKQAKCIEDLQAQIDELKKPKKKPGRPRKTEAA